MFEPEGMCQVTDKGFFGLKIPVLTILICLLVHPAVADIKAGIMAFKSGDFLRAGEEFRAHSGNPKAAYHMGIMHEYGLGEMLWNYSLALKWFERSARAGNVDALIKVAAMHQEGVGVPASLKKAAEWYKLAAERDNPRAQYLIGNMYWHGEGTPRDRTRAIFWLKKAEDQGHKSAAEALRSIRRDE